MNYRDKLLDLFTIQVNKIIVNPYVLSGYQVLLFSKGEEQFDIINLCLTEANDLLPKDKVFLDIVWHDRIIKEFDDMSTFYYVLSDYVKELVG